MCISLELGDNATHDVRFSCPSSELLNVLKPKRYRKRPVMLTNDLMSTVYICIHCLHFLPYAGQDFVLVSAVLSFA